MITIKKVIIENFQSHKYSVIDFNEGLNAIVGPTDSGKTAVFRSLKWVLYNEPQGDYFIREGEKNVSVTVEFNTGLVVKRYRGKGKNGYELTYPDGEVMVLEGFGTKVPKEIIDATKIRKIILTPSQDRSLNMAEQLDPPFLLSETPSLKAAAIGKLVDADVIDYALSDTNTDLRNKKRELNTKTEDFDKITEDLKDFEYLEDLKDIILNLEEIQKNINKFSKKLYTLENIHKQFIPLKENKKKLEVLLKSLEITDNLEQTYEIIESKNIKYQVLKRLKTNIDYNDRREKESIKLLVSLKDVDFLNDTIDKIRYKITYLNKLTSENNKYKSLIQRKSKLKNMYKKFDNLEKCYDLEDRLHYMVNKHDKLSKSKTNLNILNFRINKGKDYIKRFQNIDKIINYNQDIESLVLKLNKLEKHKIVYSNLFNKLKDEKDKIKNSTKNINNLSEEYKDLLGNLKICPTCFKPIGNTEELTKHLNEEV